jgi:hypothetical protein
MEKLPSDPVLLGAPCFDDPGVVTRTVAATPTPLALTTLPENPPVAAVWLQAGPDADKKQNAIQYRQWRQLITANSLPVHAHKRSLSEENSAARTACQNNVRRIDGGADRLWNLSSIEL